MKLYFFVEVIALLLVLQTEYSRAQEQCQDQLRNYCLARFEGIEDRIGCQTSTPPPPIIGSTYVRWGRTVCANDTGAVLVYSGRAAGSSWREDGGGADMLCLPDNPDYLNRTADTVQGHSPLTGAEFHTWVARPDLGLQNSPCAVCYVPRATSLMVPAKLSCPPTWTLEYVGYLMTKYRSQGYLKYECLDENPEFLPNLAGPAGGNGVSIHLVEASCNTGLQCPPYSAGKEVSCAVCTK